MFSAGQPVIFRAVKPKAESFAEPHDVIYFSELIFEIERGERGQEFVPLTISLTGSRPEARSGSLKLAWSNSRRFARMER